MIVPVENIQAQPTAVEARIEEIRPPKGFAFRLCDAEGADLNPAGSYLTEVPLDTLPVTEADIRAAIYAVMPQGDPVIPDEEGEP